MAVPFNSVGFLPQIPGPMLFEQLMLYSTVALQMHNSLPEG